MANEVLRAFESVGIFAATLRTKLPIKVAEALGFTTKGFGLRTIPSSVKKFLPTTASVTTKAAISTKAEAQVIGESLAFSKGLKTLTVVTVLSAVVGIVGVTSNLVLAAANVMDFGNWQGAYQKTFQRIFTAFGFPPDTPMPKSRSISPEAWAKIYTIVEELNPQTLSFPWSDEVRPYTRENLSQAVDHFAANIAASGTNPTFKDVWGLLLPTIKINPAGSATTAAQVAPRAAVAAVSVPTVKVFTGVVSQGTLGAGLTFSARPDDLIESAAELQAAATNNLAATLAALPASLSYEVKITSSVTSKDGFTQRGSVQRVVSGYNKDGSPKYRSVVNKFAVLSVYLVNDKGTRTRIRQITLGPTDAVRFQPTSNDLAGVEASVKNSVSTSDTSEIQKIITSAPLAVASLPDAPATVVQPDPLAVVFTPVTDYKDSGYRFYKHDVNGIAYFEVLPWAGNVPYGYTPITRAEAIAGLRATVNEKRFGDPSQFLAIADDIERGKYDGGSGYTFVNGVPWLIATAQEADRNKQLAAEGYLKEIPVGNGVGYIPTGKTAPGATVPSAVCASQTLWELAQARGERLPSVAERAPDYERLGLGPSGFYTGTAEQNTRLLRALQKEAGCGNA